ncbi:Mth938-like domain-containing protein [Candidatus Bathyarchaeota archaeon]|nr:Mth938-like domain-containing protein [Candidatus Bathyarchaeota archaeon]
MNVPPETVTCIESEGIQLIVQKTAEACKTFNHLIESRTVVAALHLTC